MYSNSKRKKEVIEGLDGLPPIDALRLLISKVDNIPSNVSNALQVTQI
jgi:hypothetical protein